jgi:hypothetical protein
MRRENLKTLEAEVGKIREQLRQMPAPADRENRALLKEARQFVAEIESLLRKMHKLSGSNGHAR